MPIKHSKGATTITGDSIDYFRLCAMKGAVGLELQGIKMRRGPAAWKLVAAEFNLTENKKKVYDWLCAEVERLKPVQEHVVEEDGKIKRLVEGKEVQ